MLIVWDERKRQSNLAKHHLDFASVEGGFDFTQALVLQARDSSRGRKRLRLIGELDGTLIAAIIVSPLGSEALSIISLRPASHVEQELYES